MKIGIVDTTFSRVDMGEIAIDEFKKKFDDVEIIRRTVPGIKDLAVECQILFENEKCDINMALGMVGGEPIDQVCGHEASTAIQTVMLKFSKHIIEVFVHANEALDDKDLFNLTNNRTRKHVHNAYWLVKDLEKLVQNAGTGKRQGREDAGAVKV